MHKNNNKELVENYRSISLLPFPAKCLERLVHTAIYAHISPYLSEYKYVSIIYLPSGTRGVVAQSPEPEAHDKSD